MKNNIKKYIKLLTMAIIASLIIPANAFAGTGFSDTGGASAATNSGGGSPSGNITYYEFTAGIGKMASWTKGNNVYQANAAISSTKHSGKPDFSEYAFGKDENNTNHWNVFVVKPESNRPLGNGSSSYSVERFESREDGNNLIWTGDSTPTKLKFSPTVFLNNFYAGTKNHRSVGHDYSVLGAFRPVPNSTSDYDFKKVVNARYERFSVSNHKETYLPSHGFAGDNNGDTVGNYSGYVRGNMTASNKFSNSNYDGKPRIKFDMGNIYNDLTNKEGRYALYWYRLNHREAVKASGRVHATISRPRLNIAVYEKIDKSKGTEFSNLRLANATWNLSFDNKDYLINKSNKTNATKIWGTRNGKVDGNAYLEDGEKITKGYALPTSYSDGNKTHAYTLSTNYGKTFKGASIKVLYQSFQDMSNGTSARTWSMSPKLTISGTTATFSKLNFGQLDGNSSKGGLYTVSIIIDDTSSGGGETGGGDSIGLGSQTEINSSDIEGPTSWFSSNKPARYSFPKTTPITYDSRATNGYNYKDSYEIKEPYKTYLWAPIEPNWIAKKTSAGLADVEYREYTADGNNKISLDFKWTKGNVGIKSKILNLTDNRGEYASVSAAVSALNPVQYGYTLKSGICLYGNIMYKVSRYKWVDDEVDDKVDNGHYELYQTRYTWSGLNTKNINVYDSTGVN